MENEKNENMSFAELLDSSMKNNKKLGKVVTGKVIEVTNDNEIYVDLDYKADGIVPKNEYSFDETKDPHDEFKSGDEITCEVLKHNDGFGNVLLSYKRISKKVSKDKFWKEAEVGKAYEGTVSSVCSYGAFIDICGVQGLLHISEISWERNDNANNYLKPGQKIKVYIKDIDKENKRIQLSCELKGEDPWASVNLKVGDVVKVTIKKLLPFGAFAEIKKGVEGLIHISQISDERIAKPEDKLKVGEVVNAKVINIDLENKKIELSIRDLIGTSEEYSSLDKEE
jgi:4-hydroxy-3-methylbut-2-enyl diphosphate reductase